MVLATSQDAVQIKKRGVQSDFDDVEKETEPKRRVSVYEEAPGFRLGPRDHVASTIHRFLPAAV
jgi:hypothetical protein